ncbi:formate dehydrogenase accessory sulfurtransferase FdhD [Palleronia abyssalis]|uniref:Sulfurtransferase FdhD n=1 Tax=Palleronia abyssalis TaxID=1501240 RepID=A0A2R8BXH1_9RHOB|nr:formate dehydrogenase accessory sulfurtransferase FdhD [Palleronia abyssalis]SPJ24849.1 Sulfurtransferase FdhD [Palleronia abyssalis]
MAKDIAEHDAPPFPVPVSHARFTDAKGPLTRAVPVETPVAVEVNGVSFAVMMATPADLEDFATGFAMAESLIEGPDDIAGVDICPIQHGIVLRLTLAGPARQIGLDRARARVTESACGLCGVENINALSAPLPRVKTPLTFSPEAVTSALFNLRHHQTLGRLTSGTHAAALCTPDGQIVLCREDIGRHTALDKAIGAGARAGTGFGGIFALVTSRLSYELVEKAARAGLGGLAAMSTPSSLALSRAAQAGLPVVACAKPDGMLTAAP